jgi:hypothetical protein
MTATIRKMTKRIYAILVAVPATPESPSTPAMIATTRNVIAQLSMIHLLQIKSVHAMLRSLYSPTVYGNLSHSSLQVPDF